jgi:hypothetical protein
MASATTAFDALSYLHHELSVPRTEFETAILSLEEAITVAEAFPTFESATDLCLKSREAFAVAYAAIRLGEVPRQVRRRFRDALGRATSATERIAATDKSDRAIVDMYAKSIGSRFRCADGLLDEKSIPAEIRLAAFSPEHYEWLLKDTNRLLHLTDGDFEKLVADRLSAMGLCVRIVGSTHQKDGGIDIVAWPEGRAGFPFLLAAQVKHHRTQRKTGVKDVREFHGVVTSKGSVFSLGVIVTNTAFTADAKWFAANNNVILRLRDLYDLCRWMESDFVSESDWREIPREIELGPGITVAVANRSVWLPRA